MWHVLIDFVKGLFSGKGTTQIGWHNKSVSTGDNSGTIVLGDVHLTQAALPKEEPGRLLSTARRKILLVKTLKDRNHNLVIWTPFVDHKTRMQTAGNLIYPNDASNLEITDWHEAFEEIKPYYLERTEGNYFLKSDGRKLADEIAAREPELVVL